MANGSLPKHSIINGLMSLTSRLLLSAGGAAHSTIPEGSPVTWKVAPESATYSSLTPASKTSIPNLESFAFLRGRTQCVVKR